ncbi:MAG: hypothetical protein CHACPFDD_01263 [Phycisphaerae bacterium]|nr:hypothetical protein [Phycisphaerae bacterium]
MKRYRTGPPTADRTTRIAVSATISGTLHYPLWRRGDLDGFFGLMVDNLVQVLLIVALCVTQAGIPESVVHERVLPGVAVSLLVGNLFYGLQARAVARRHNNPTCTALPYGINTPTVFAYVFFIMGPVNRAALADGLDPAAAGLLAWKAGLVACLVSGAIEFGGAFFAEQLRRVTPRAALLGVLAAVGVTFISADFAFRIYAQPLVGILPLAILLLAYFASYRFPLGLPGGSLAILSGTAMAWLVSIPAVADAAGTRPLMSLDALRAAAAQLHAIIPTFVGGEIAALVRDQPDLLLRFLTVSVPMGLLNVFGSVQNIESAEAAGDRFNTAPSLAVNGIGSLCAGLFGSCFPTTIYIGHPAWKSLGAGCGYSIANGLFFTACFACGAGALLGRLIPIEAGAAMVVYIGIIITAQAFQATPRAHAPAVAVALFPAIAALLIVNLPLFMVDAGASRTLAEMLTGADDALVPALTGMVTLTGANSGWLVGSVVLVAAATSLIDHRYRAAALWFAVATVLTAAGVLHAYRVEGNDVRELFIWQAAPPSAGIVAYRAYPIALAYALATVMLALVAWRSRTTAVANHEERPANRE